MYRHAFIHYFLYVSYQLGHAIMLQWNQNVSFLAVIVKSLFMLFFKSMASTISQLVMSDRTAKISSTSKKYGPHQTSEIHYVV